MIRIFKIPLITRFWFVLLLVSYLVFSYNYLGQWWHAACGTILIIFFSERIWRREFLSVTGLKINWRIILYAGMLTFLVFYISLSLIKLMAGNHDISIRPHSWRSGFHIAFYVLNEEIVLGAVILFLMVKRLNLKAVSATIYLALFFALMHFVFYRWVFDDRGILEVSTLISLFMIGIFRNTLILYFDQIAYSWAFHFAWMLVMFGFDHTGGTHGESLAEFSRFNLYLGTWQMIIISSFLASAGILFLHKKSKTAGQLL